MARTTLVVSPSATLATIEHLIEIAQEEIASLEAEAAGGLPGTVKSAPGVSVPVTSDTSTAPSLAERIENLDLVVDRLRKIKEWLTQDPRMLPLVDDYIGQQVRAMEQRQSAQNVRLAVITTVAGVVMGWLVSLMGTPATVLHLFGH